MEIAFYKRWHSHPYREALRHAALGHEVADDALPSEAEGVARMQLRAAATYLTDQAGKVGNIGRPRLAATADRLSAQILEGVEELSLEDPDDQAEPGELVDSVRRKHRGW